MTPPPSARDDASGPAPLPTAAALACGLLAGWALRGAGFAAVEALLVAGVGGLAAYSCLNYVVTRLSAE